MTIAEIRGIEENRHSAEQFAVIHLLKENSGKEFYRAHDWSAWLMTMFPMGDAANNPLKISAKRLKDGYIEVWVGFPVTSLGKYIPDDGSVGFEAVNDNQIDVTIQLPEEYEGGDEDQFRMAVDEWKEQLPLNGSKKARREEQEMAEAAPRVVRFSDIISQIVSYPLESKSPIEAWEFMRQLRQKVTAMF